MTRICWTDDEEAQGMLLEPADRHDDILSTHFGMSGAGRPVNIGSFHVEDPEAVRTALREEGHELAHRPDLRQEYHSAL